MKRNLKIDIQVSQRHPNLCLSTCRFYDKSSGNLPAYCELFCENLKFDVTRKNWLRCRKCKTREVA